MVNSPYQALGHGRIGQRVLVYSLTSSGNSLSRARRFISDITKPVGMRSAPKKSCRPQMHSEFHDAYEDFRPRHTPDAVQIPSDQRNVTSATAPDMSKFSLGSSDQTTVPTYEYNETLLRSTDGKFRIRILKILPGNHGEPLQAELEVADLDDSPAFDALSYCWGDPDPKYPIMVNGTIFGVTANLRSALYQLRKEEACRRVWVDAICINQQSNEEKSQQVGRMSDIYVRARQTIIWLGEEADNSDLALQMCTRIHKEYSTILGLEALKLDGDEAYVLRKELEILADGELDLSCAWEPWVRNAYAKWLDGEYNGPLKKYLSNIWQRTSKEPVDERLETEQASAAGADAASTTSNSDNHDSGALQETAVCLADSNRSESREDVQELAPTSEAALCYSPANEDLEENATGQQFMAPDSGVSAENLRKTYRLSQIQSEDLSRSKDRLEQVENGQVLHLPVDDAKTEVNTLRDNPADIQVERPKWYEDPSVLDPRSKPSSDEVLALYKILERPWFQRIWVIQEVAKSGTVIIQCGQSSMMWNFLAPAYTITTFLKRGTSMAPLYHKNMDLMIHTQIRVQATPAEVAGNPELELLSLMWMYRGFSATDPRDKIFALLGLTNTDLVKLDIRPDYSKTTDEVYLSVAQSLVQSAKSLELLSIPKETSDQTTRLPSWVPMWNVEKRVRWPFATTLSRPLLKNLENVTRIFAASANSQADPRILQGGKLVLQGYKVDKIVDRTPEMIQFMYENLGKAVLDSESKSESEAFAVVLATVRYVSTQVKAFEETIDAWTSFVNIDEPQELDILARTFYADAYIETASDRFRIWMSVYKLLLEMYAALPSLEVEHPTAEYMSKIFETHRLHLPKINAARKDCLDAGSFYMCDRRLGRLQSGKIGLLPSEAEIGDEIYLLRGSTTPHVLRKSGEDFEHIGEAFVHTMMYGEAWRDERCHQICLI